MLGVHVICENFWKSFIKTKIPIVSKIQITTAPFYNDKMGAVNSCSLQPHFDL
jgi:hypothetical protein